MKKAIVGFSLLICLSASAQFKSGNKLLEQIRGSHGEQMLALGYITGVSDTLSGATVCLPSELTAGQAMDITKKYLEDYPAVRHMAADAIINRALSVIWPCAKKGGGV
jgi:hypothetical protein